MEDIIFTTQAVIADGVNPGKLPKRKKKSLDLPRKFGIDFWNYLSTIRWK